MAGARQRRIDAGSQGRRQQCGRDCRHECVAVYDWTIEGCYNGEKVDNAEVARSSVNVVVQPAFRFLAPIRQSA